VAGIDYSPLFRQAPQSGFSRGATHLSSVLDAIMDRDARAAQHKAQLEQAARLAAEDDARQRAQLDQTIAHQQAQEERLRAKDAQDADDKTATRSLQALPHVTESLDSGNEAAAQAWGQAGGMKVAPQMTQESPGDEVSRLLAEPPDTSAAPFPMDVLSATLAREQKAPPVPKPTGRYSIGMRGGEPIDYDPGASRRMELGESRSPSPFDAQARAETEDLIASKKLDPKDAIKYYTSRREHLEDQANSIAKTRMLAASKPEQPSGVVYDPTTGKPIATAPFKKDAGSINDTTKAAVDFNNIVQQLRDSFAKGRVLPKGAEAQRRKALVAQAGLAIKNNEDLGALVGGDWKIISDQVGEGEAWAYITDPTPSIDQALASSAAKLSTFLGSKGLPGAKLAPQVLGGGAGAANAPADNRTRAKSLVDRVMGGAK
jgi:hypothetical protein